MSTKQTKHPGRRLVTTLLIIAVGYGVLAFGALTHRTSMTPGLALDLEGGTQIILTPTTSDGSAISDTDIEQAIEVIRQRVDASGVAEAQIARQGGQNIVVSLPGTPSQETLELVRTSAVLYFRPVLRIINGNATAMAAAQNEAVAAQEGAAPSGAPSAAPTEEPAAEQGAGDPATEPAEEPAAEAPDEGAADEQAAEGPAASQEQAAGETGETTETTAPAQEEPIPAPTASVTPEEIATYFADVNQDGTISEEPLESTSQDNSSDSWITEKMIYDAYMLDCTAPENLTGAGQDPATAVISCAKDGSGTVYILGPADIAGTSIANASSGLESTSQGGTTNNWVVSLEFDEEGAAAFAAVSERLLAYRDAAAMASLSSPDAGALSVDAQKSRFAIVLDGLTIMASGFEPTVTTPITDGRVQIGGGGASFTQAEASTLANQLSFGALPLSFTVQSEQQISATLGTEQLRNGLIAGLVGFLLIIVFLAWQYRGLSVVAVASLVIAAVGTYLVIALLSWAMGYRLSLAGVAGLIIAIGITMDSFIIYFERIRDEVRHGRTLLVAVDEGWTHARQTIVVSDAVNLVAAVVLYFLAVGGVQGFAFTLGVTTVVDLAVIVLFTHPMMVWILRFRFFGQGHPLSGLDPEHLGARSRAAYGKGRQTLIEGAAGSLARRKAAARRAKNSDDAGDDQSTSGKDGEAQ